MQYNSLQRYLVTNSANSNIPSLTLVLLYLRQYPDKDPLLLSNSYSTDTPTTTSLRGSPQSTEMSFFSYFFRDLNKLLNFFILVPLV